jgi:hypothetical protein
MLKSQHSTARETLGRMASVRWLADLCGLPPTDDFPDLASALLDDVRLEGAVTAYVDWWIRHPDPLSRFERSTRHLLKMPDAMRVATLLKMGYDGLLYQREGEIVGHVFFQRHGADLCAFSSSISERYRGGKRWAIFLMDFVAFASQRADVTRARVGGGNHPITRGLVALIKPHVSGLGWRVSRDGWINFSARKNAGLSRA